MARMARAKRLAADVRRQRWMIVFKRRKEEGHIVKHVKEHVAESQKKMKLVDKFTTEGNANSDAFTKLERLETMATFQFAEQTSIS